MNRLTSIDIIQLQAKAEPLPVLEVISPWIEQLICQICYTYKPEAMVFHYDCMRPFCASCAHALITQGTTAHCGHCRQSIWEKVQEIFTTKFFLPTPNDRWLMDNLEFRCPDCKANFKIGPARTHPNQCQKSTRFVPPAYIHNWQEVPLVRRMTVSNPIQIGPSATRDRLLIYHHNGNQIGSKFVKATWEISRVKEQIARLADVDANDIRIYKFFHTELRNEDTVGDIAPGSGSTHLTSLTQLADLDTRTAIILVQDAGPPPRIHRPPGARGRAIV